MRVAFLGPKTFSEQFVAATFSPCERLSCETFTDLLEVASSERCDFGIAPLENNNSGTVTQFQRELLTFRGRVFVTDLYSHRVIHHLFSRADLGHIQEVRSFAPALAQSEKWLSRHMPHATRNCDGFKSTTDAVGSIVPMPAHFGVAAIASEDARECGVPIIARGIQNEPNFTTFCRIERTRPSAEGASRFLLAVPESQSEDENGIDSALGHCACFYSSTWLVGGNPAIRMFEVFNATGPRVQEVQVHCAERALKNSFFVGCYFGKTLTHISVSPPQKPPQKTSSEQ